MMDAPTKLRRFCFVRNFDPVYVTQKSELDVSFYMPKILAICDQLSDEIFLPILNEVLNNKAENRDEPMFVYAVYLSCLKNEKWKHNMRIAFPNLIKSDEDLFLFCKYAKLIQRCMGLKSLRQAIKKALNAWYMKETPESLQEMWLGHRGGHGFTHKELLRLCHFNVTKIGQGTELEPFFKSCTQLLQQQEMKAILNDEDENITEQSTDSLEDTSNDCFPIELPTSPIIAISKLRTSVKRDEALGIIRKFNIKFKQVPSELLRYACIVEALLPTMSYMEILNNWEYLASFWHFENKKIFTICKGMLEDKNVLNESDIHPIIFLIYIHKMRLGGDPLHIAPRKIKALKMHFIKELYLKSFGVNKPIGLRMHIAMFLQPNYKKKNLRNFKNMTYYEVAIALAFSYFKTEKEVDVFHWSEENLKLKEIQWTKEMDLLAATERCDAIELKTCSLRLLTPILHGLMTKKVYDVFIAIVPSAGRGNPNKSSRLLCQFLDKYRCTINPLAKFIIIDVIRLKKSMEYNKTRNENILEICGIDKQTPNLIRNFASNCFG